MASSRAERTPTLAELMGAYDWKEVMKYATGWSFADIERVLLQFEGEADERDWLLLCKLKSGGYGYVSAGCDYTGWGCQEGGEGGVVETLDAAKARFLKLVSSHDTRKADIEAAVAEVRA